MALGTASQKMYLQQGVCLQSCGMSDSDKVVFENMHLQRDMSNIIENVFLEGEHQGCKSFLFA